MCLIAVADMVTSVVANDDSILPNGRFKETIIYQILLLSRALLGYKISRDSALSNRL